MDDRKIADCPERDRDEIRRVVATFGGAIVLCADGLLGSEAQEFILRYRKEHGELPSYDQVWVGAIEND